MWSWLPELGACCEFRKYQKVLLLHPLTSPGRWENATALMFWKSTGPHRNLEIFGLLFAFYFNLAPKLTNKKQQGKEESWEFHRLPARESHKPNKMQETLMHIFLYFFPKTPLSCLFSPMVRGKDSIWPWRIQTMLTGHHGLNAECLRFCQRTCCKWRGFKYSWVMPKSSKHSFCPLE